MSIKLLAARMCFRRSRRTTTEPCLQSAVYSSTASDPQLRADSRIHWSLVIALVDVQTGLWKRRSDRSSDTSGTPPPDGAERSCTVDSETSTLRSYNRCTGQLALVPRSRSYTDTLSNKPGGIVVAASSGLRLSTVDLGIEPPTFELHVMRSYRFRFIKSSIAATINQPGCFDPHTRLEHSADSDAVHSSSTIWRCVVLHTA